ncbi:MAG TPA: helix-turn-helix domain-containing protein [Pseudonocardia sp.]|uniref:sigma-54-dependent Fis family transcriptional regulator n=1 Tax=Pseudonocardia sp. TaxID=60912 RepID=UPI002B4AFBF2|nr:helix-turn-helix domain-containing protein [Pseudonocardia sp.]HLU60082.1 helix-turn-helix domain-containing protein [Pseudonocardia sp.]
MGELADRAHRLTCARAAFLDRADADLRGVPDHVAASWRRSVSRGVHPDVVVTEYHDDLDLGSRLVRCARPVIEQLAEQIADIPMCVALTDDRARLLVRRDTSPWFGRIADRQCFAQGFGYSEDAVGTNGVGTVFEFGESVHIVGAEHFVESLQPYACAGAPVRDPFTGRIEGVLDISCLREHSSPILHSLVRSAAARIQRNLLADRNEQQQALFDAYTRLDARSREAVLAVGPRTVMANTPMQTLLDPGDVVALQDHVRFVMTRHASVDDRLDLPSGTRVRVRGSTVVVGGAVAGAVAVVGVLNEVDVADLVPAPRPAENGSAAWRAASAAVAQALRDGAPALVIGEPGSGRFTLVAELHRSAREDGRAVGIAPERVAAAPEEVAAAIAAAGPAVLYVLRDVDRVPAAAVDTLVAALGGGVPPFAATAAQPAHDGLLAVMRTSATVPPLRARTGDLPALARALLAELAPRRDVRLSRAALRLLGRYDWPGNVAQLRDALASALRRRPVGCIGPADLPEFCQSAPRTALRPVDRAERDAIVSALRTAGGNRVAAAAALGLARSTLYRKIRQYGITV